MKIRNVKGIKDFLPEEQFLRKNIVKTIESTFEKYGFKPVETSIINYSSLLESKYGGGDEIIKEIYKLTDRGSRSLSLRYDLTQPFIKLLSLNPKMRVPFKRYEIGKVFRDGPIKKGRLREFTQCDADVLGISDFAIEAELFSIIRDVASNLNINVLIQYNNKKIMSGILSEFIPNDFIDKVILILDKCEKIGRQGINQELLELNFNQNTLNEIEKFINIVQDNNLTTLANTYSNDLVAEGIKEVKDLNVYLRELKLDTMVNLNLLLARGLNIYDGTIYEAFAIDSEITSSLASGGRYDNVLNFLAEKNEATPAIGLSLGLDVIHEILLDQNENSNITATEVLIVPLGTVKESLNIAGKLRRHSNLNVEVELTNRNIKKALNYANKEKIPFTIILGENEIKNNLLKIKNMETGVTTSYTLDSLSNKIIL